MVLACVVRNCRNARDSTMEKNCILFSIPKDMDRYNEWLINCGRKELCSKSVDKVYDYFGVCMNHFKENMFSNTQKTLLLISAVPTEFVMPTTITTTSNSVGDSTMVLHNGSPSTSMSQSTTTLDELRTPSLPAASMLREMDENNFQHLPYEDDQTRVMKFERCEPKKFINNFHAAKVIWALQSLRIDDESCDIKLETDDGTVVLGHKSVLASASPYFRAMFTSFKESNKDNIHMKELDSTVLQLLVNYIYTGQIIVNEENAQDILAAADLIQLDYIKSACVEFLHTQIKVSTCLGIRAIADLHNCRELLSSSDVFCKKQFLKVVKYDEFLRSSPEEVIQLISCSDLAVPKEEYVYESILKWVKYDLSCRKQFFPDLMEHVRLPLTSIQYILKIVSEEESLLKNNHKCKDYLIEAINFHLLKSQKKITIPKTIRCKPRQSGGLQKVILMFSTQPLMDNNFMSWYDPTSNLCHTAQEINEMCRIHELALIADQFVIAVGRHYDSTKCYPFVKMLDLFSRKCSWVPMVNMLVDRQNLGIAVLNNSIYAVGGEYGSKCLNSAEIFDVNLEEWKMISSMAYKRCDFGVGILNNLLYAVGGYNNCTREYLNSVECYDPSLDTWKLVAPMSKPRYNVGIGVIDGVMYAVGGKNSSGYCNSVEAYRPSVGEWTSVADLPYGTYSNKVVVLDGLLYVLGHKECITILNILVYNPNTNAWQSMKSRVNDTGFIFAAVPVDRPSRFKTD